MRPSRTSARRSPDFAKTDEAAGSDLGKFRGLRGAAFGNWRCRRAGTRRADVSSVATHPLQAGEVVRIRDERWRIVRRTTYALSTAIEAAGCDAANRGGRATFLLPFETIERFQAHPVPRVVGRRRWRRAARRTLATASPSLTSLRAAAPARLRIMSFQLEPVLALVRGEGCRFLIADAVGLGKTVQAGLMIAETLARRSEGRTLVVTPAALREQWQEEIESRFGLGADILDAAGAPIGRVTSGGFAPTLGRAIALGFVPPIHATPGARLQVSVRGRAQPAVVAETPFVPHRYLRKAS